jgi:SAM-dependent methyltransferase
MSVDYEQAVATAPPGWRHFSIDDVARLPREVRSRETARIPPGETDERILRALFWTLVYHLEPERWDELARHEPIHPAIVDALPRGLRRGLDVGAGSGRLTAHLVERCEAVTAVEPSAGLRAILSLRLPGVRVEHGWSDSLPFGDASFDLVAACGVIGPEPATLDELRRVAAPGGWIALVSPEQPEWFEAGGWDRISAEPIPAPPHPSWIDEFFGQPDPPHELVMTRRLP